MSSQCAVTARRGDAGRREDADAVQVVFAAVLQSSHHLAEVKNLTAYLFTALRRAAGRSAARRVREPRTGEAAIAEIAAKTDADDQSRFDGERHKGPAGPARGAAR